MSTIRAFLMPLLSQRLKKRFYIPPCSRLHFMQHILRGLLVEPITENPAPWAVNIGVR